jgi:TolB-like protein/class 3 adenylate cyclase
LYQLGVTTLATLRQCPLGQNTTQPILTVASRVASKRERVDEDRSDLRERRATEKTIGCSGAASWAMASRDPLMAEETQSRRLTTIVALDVAGYSARTEVDEARSAAEVAALRGVIEEIARARGGRVFSTAGDGFMLEFGSSLAAVEAAFALAERCDPKVRIGVHLGDVVVQPNGDLLGHGVNVAARLMARSDPGSALVSADVRRTIRGPLAERLVSRGNLQLDKMTETIEAFAPAAVGSVVVTAPSGSGEPLLAVLPFDNLSDDREMQFFSDGVSEEIIQRLSRGARMKVIGRTSSFQFRGADKTARKVSDELKCTHILDGSIRRAGGRVRISAHLVEAASQTTLWSDRYDGSLEDMFAVQDEIAERVAVALDETFTSFSTKAIDPSVYDLYLRASLRSYAPDELRTNVGLLEVVTQRAPDFAQAWGRLAFSRVWLRFYQPFTERAASGDRVMREATRALALDPQNVDALLAQLLVRPPFGRFVEGDAAVERARRAPGLSAGQIYIGWYLRNFGWVRESVEETERGYRLDALNPMAANIVAVARMSAGRVAEAVPVFEDLMARVPDMSFPVANLLRAKAFLGEWAAVDRLLDPSAKLPLREFQDGVAFIQAKRNPTPENIGGIRTALEVHLERTGSVDVSRLVYAAHLGLVDEAYHAVEAARLGPRGTTDDIMGPDGYRTGLLFHAGMPELRNDPRFVPLCARLGLVEFWLATGKWPDCVDEVPYDFKAACDKARSISIEEFGF